MRARQILIFISIILIFISITLKSVIEIVGYSYGRWFFLLPFQSLNHDGRNKHKHHYLKKGRKQSKNLWSKDVLILHCVMFDFRCDIWVTLRWFLKKVTLLRLQGLCE